LSGFDAIVFDPPRAGAEAQARALAASKVPLVVAVSCNVQSFARDAALLTGGGYQIEGVTPYDQFRYSPHVEIVGIFRRPEKPRTRRLLG
jgi:23S rRNA (uracil1939-C5)-methyltransferase